MRCNPILNSSDILSIADNALQYSMFWVVRGIPN